MKTVTLHAAADAAATADPDAAVEPDPAGWITVCRLDEIPRLGARRVTRSHGGTIALFRTADDAVHALLDRCPHRGGPLSQGIVFGASVACPLHNWTIALADGRATAPDVGSTPVFRVRVTGDTVALSQADLARPDPPVDADGACAHAPCSPAPIVVVGAAAKRVATDAPVA